MKIYTIQDLTNLKVLKILEFGLMSAVDTHIRKNYHPDYKNDSANLFYILEQGRYKIGKYFVITDDNDNYIASAGWNEYDNDTALCLTRMYISPKYRSNFMIGEFVLPRIFTETTKYNKLWMTVNDYNKPLYNWFVRNQRINSIGNWPELYKKFKPIGQKMVNYTAQHVLEYDRSKENN
jgi:hypothetical protein